MLAGEVVNIVGLIDPAPQDADAPGLAYVFLCFGIVALPAAVVMAAFGTETCGRVLEELSP